MTDAALTVGSVTQTTGLFLAVLPSIRDIRQTSQGTQSAADIRSAEALAVGLSLGTGVVMGMLGKSSAPVYAALATTATLVIVTEYLLRRSSPPTLRIVNDGDSVYTEGIPHE